MKCLSVLSVILINKVIQCLESVIELANFSDHTTFQKMICQLQFLSFIYFHWLYM